MARKQAPEREMKLGKAPPRWQHQDESYSFFSAIDRGFDNSSPGTGKTRVQIEVYRDRPNRGRWLIVCPKTLMVSAWANDIEKFAPTLTYSIATAENREEAFKQNTDVVIINTDGVKWFTDKANAKKAQAYLKGFTDLTIDEYTTFKHPTSQRSKAMRAISKYFKRRFGMSGTPNPNSVTELFFPALIIDDGKRLGTLWSKFRSSVQIPIQIGPRPEHLKWEDKPGAAQAVNELLHDITIRHAFEDVMTHVPPNFKHVKEFDLSPRMRKIYDKMESEALVAFEDNTSVNAVHAAALRTKLLQIASGAVYDGGEDSSYKLVDTTRYDLTAELVETVDHAVVFFNWKHQRDYMAKTFAARDISYAIIDGDVPQKQRDQIVEDYQAGKYQVVMLHPKTGAHGLTLTRGTLTIFPSPLYEADLMLQGLQRIYRGDQDQVTNTVFIQARRTVEGSKVYPRLFEKYEGMSDLLTLQQESTQARRKLARKK